MRNKIIFFVLIFLFSCKNEKKNIVVPFSYGIPYSKWSYDSTIIFNIMGRKISPDTSFYEAYIMNYRHWRYEIYIKTRPLGYERIDGFIVTPLIGGQSKEQLFADFGICSLDTLKGIGFADIQFGRFDSNIKIINRFGVLTKLSSMRQLWGDITKEKDLDKLDGMCIRSIINSKYKYCRFDNIFKSDSAFYNNMKRHFAGTMKLDYLREMK